MSEKTVPPVPEKVDGERLEDLMRDPVNNLLKIAELLGQLEPDVPPKLSKDRP